MFYFVEDDKKVGKLPPKYLSIEGHEDCMGTIEKGSVTVVCLHSMQKENCTDEARKALVDLRNDMEDDYPGMELCDAEDYYSGMIFTKRFKKVYNFLYLLDINNSIKN